MAYKKRTTRKSGSRTSGGYSRKRTAARSGGKGARSAGRSVSTLRIVVEQPQAVSSVGVVPATAKSARKAQF